MSVERSICPAADSHRSDSFLFLRFLTKGSLTMPFEILKLQSSFEPDCILGRPNSGAFKVLLQHSRRSRGSVRTNLYPSISASVRHQVCFDISKNCLAYNCDSLELLRRCHSQVVLATPPQVFLCFREKMADYMSKEDTWTWEILFYQKCVYAGHLRLWHSAWCYKLMMSVRTQYFMLIILFRLNCGCKLLPGTMSHICLMSRCVLHSIETDNLYYSCINGLCKTAWHCLVSQQSSRIPIIGKHSATKSHQSLEMESQLFWPTHVLQFTVAHHT